MKNVLKLALVLSIAILAPAALAQSATGNLAVGATVVAACTVNASSISFGSWDSRTTGSDATPTGTVSVTCTNGSPYSVDLGLGANNQGAIDGQGRRMKDAGTNYLSYMLYTSGARDTFWGTASGAGVDDVDGTGNGQSQDLTVYGTLPIAGNNVPVGSYSDSVEITVNF